MSHSDYYLIPDMVISNTTVLNNNQTEIYYDNYKNDFKDFSPKDYYTDYLRPPGGLDKNLDEYEYDGRSIPEFQYMMCDLQMLTSKFEKFMSGYYLFVFGLGLLINFMVIFNKIMDDEEVFEDRLQKVQEEIQEQFHKSTTNVQTLVGQDYIPSNNNLKSKNDQSQHTTSFVGSDTFLNSQTGTFDESEVNSDARGAKFRDVVFKAKSQLESRTSNSKTTNTPFNNTTAKFKSLLNKGHMTTPLHTYRVVFLNRWN